MRQNCQEHMQINLLANKGNLLLFGPPGIGKSTLIKALAKIGIPTFDLERLSSLEERTEWVKRHSGFIIGAADLNPNIHYKHSASCLLTMRSQASYDARRASRDAADPAKMLQPHHDLNKWLTHNAQQKFHYMVSVDGDVVHVCHQVLNRFQNLSQDPCLDFKIRRARALLFKGVVR